jgi:pyridoxal phosphate phosphatase PHOSPHO2
MMEDTTRPVQNDPRDILVVFDFDRTLISENSDVVLFDQLPYGQPLRPRFSALRGERRLGWTQIMQTQLADLAVQQGYSKDDVLQCLRSVIMDPILLDALRALRSSQSPRVVMAIASDANTIFIDEILRSNGLGEGLFEAVHTNPAVWAEGDVIHVEPYQPVDAPHSCARGCSANMCKGKILREVREKLGLKDVEGLRTIFVGDGTNDFCPSLSLGPNDLVLAREGFALQKLIDEANAADGEGAAGGHIGPPAQILDRGGNHTSTEGGRSGVQRVVAETKLWKTQKDLGKLLLRLVGRSPEEL